MVLLILNFETGECDCPFWTVAALVESNFDGASLEDAFVSYFEAADEDLTFEEIIEDVLNSMGWRWHFVDTKIPSCDYMHTMWL
jgi:hypothetical protein